MPTGGGGGGLPLSLLSGWIHAGSLDFPFPGVPSLFLCVSYHPIWWGRSLLSLSLFVVFLSLSPADISSQSNILERGTWRPETEPQPPRRMRHGRSNDAGFVTSVGRRAGNHRERIETAKRRRSQRDTNCTVSSLLPF